ncbi:MAG TPA: macro domain-containing protein [Pseudonocardiaceae bacterium]|jgi:hypothetical protein|nr:macro domain-containing protein [Pseudonocardiaceae bacterium]
MARIRVSVLGPVLLQVDGTEVRLTTLTARLLVRLVAAEGSGVPVTDLLADVWGIREEQPQRQSRVNRNQVQKHVLALRQALAAGHTGAAEVLRTEQVVSGRGQVSAYRLVLATEELDCAEFAELIGRALRSSTASAEELLTRALALWRGRPLAEAGDAACCAALVRRLTGLYETARADIIRTRVELGRFDLALPVAERIAEQRPDDPAALETLGMLRERVRALHRHEVLRREFTGLRTRLVVLRGDLFDQLDANLVIGFSDTFDIATGRDFVISRASVQGQLLERVFDGQQKILDGELRRGLRPLTPVSVESVRDKPKGKRLRYPIGTVVAVPVDGRRILATAYSRLGNDLVARSSAEDLRHGLDQAWAAAAVHGLFQPVAVPLVGAGLARIRELSPDQLMIMIVDTFVQACRKYSVITPELRIVIRPEALPEIAIAEVARHVDGLDQDGIAFDS